MWLKSLSLPWLIIILGSLLRLASLGLLPPGLYLDEVLYGLDAFSLLKTGRDIYGHFLPLAFQSSGYYPPAYPYILAPFLAVFGLYPWVVRLPAAVSGIASLFGIYLLAKKLFPSRFTLVPLLSLTFLALSPWHIHFSKVAFLASFGLSFLIFGTYCFFASLRQPQWLIVSALLFSLTPFIHYGYQLLSPAIFGLLCVLYWPHIKRHPKVSFITLFIWLVTALLLWLAYTRFHAGFRVNQLQGASLPNMLGDYLRTFTFDLFTLHQGYERLANPWARGVFQFSLLPLLLTGLIRLTRLKFSTALILVSLLLLTPIPSVMAGSGNHPVRNSPWLIPLTLLMALGGETWFKTVRSSMVSKIIVAGWVVLYLGETFSLLKFYWQDYSRLYGSFWGRPQLEAVNLARRRQEQFDQVIFIDSYNVILAYYAFVNRTSPVDIQTAISQPTSINDLPARKLNHTYFLTTESSWNEQSLSSLPAHSLLIDPFFFIHNLPTNTVKFGSEPLFQYQVL